MNTAHRIASALPDVAAVVVFGVLMRLGTLEPSSGVPAILAVLAGRLYPRPVPRLGDHRSAPPSEPPSGVATLVLAGFAAASSVAHYAAGLVAAGHLSRVHRGGA